MIGALFAKLLTRRSFDAINKGDVDSLLASWHEDAVLTYSGKLSVSGTREGKQAIRTWFQHFKERVPTRTFRPRAVCVENIFDVFGTNVVAIVWEDRPINKNGRKFYVRGVTVSRIRWGKVVEATIYVLEQDLLSEIWGENAT